MSEGVFDRVRKKYTVEKKNSRKKWVREKSCEHFSEKKNFKKIENFKNKFFSKLLFHFWTWREKKVFFSKFFSAQISTKILKMSQKAASHKSPGIDLELFRASFLYPKERFKHWARHFWRHRCIMKESSLHPPFSWFFKWVGFQFFSWPVGCFSLLLGLFPIFQLASRVFQLAFGFFQLTRRSFQLAVLTSVTQNTLISSA